MLHMALVFAVIHLYNVFLICTASVHSFFFFDTFFFFNLVLINRRNDPQYQRVLALCAFLTGAILKEQFFFVCVCLKFVYVLFYVNLCRDRFCVFFDS